MENESDGDTSCSWSPWKSPQGFEKKTEKIKDQRNIETT